MSNFTYTDETAARQRYTELDGQSSFTATEQEEFNELVDEFGTLTPRKSLDHMETRGGNPAIASNYEIRGEPQENLRPGQSMRTWVERAAENGVTTTANGRTEKVRSHSDAYLNEYWAQRLGLRPPGAELRALGEDTSGSGLAITPQSWTSQYVDFLYAASILGRLGVTRFVMETEIVNKPVLTAPAAPSWLAENSSIGIDANPAFSTLAFNANGGFKDITLFSLELAQDAYAEGTLGGLLAETVARNMALAVDAAGIVGVSGNSSGYPGLIAETGFNTRTYTGDAGSGKAPTDTTEFSLVLEAIANKNVDIEDPAMNLAILSNPSVYHTVKRLNASTYAKFWEMPDDCADLPWVRSANSNVLPTTETDGTTPALTGGALSSFYMGPWSFMLAGTHLDLNTRTLTERYVDAGQLGIFSFYRGSIRTGHAEAFYRTSSIVTA